MLKRRRVNCNFIDFILRYQTTLRIRLSWILSYSLHNLCFHGAMRKISIILAVILYRKVNKNVLTYSLICSRINYLFINSNKRCKKSFGNFKVKVMLFCNVKLEFESISSLSTYFLSCCLS